MYTLNYDLSSRKHLYKTEYKDVRNFTYVFEIILTPKPSNKRG